MTQLKVLDLNGCSKFDSNLIKEFSKLPNLEKYRGPKGLANLFTVPNKVYFINSSKSSFGDKYFLSDGKDTLFEVNIAHIVELFQYPDRFGFPSDESRQFKNYEIRKTAAQGNYFIFADSEIKMEFRTGFIPQMTSFLNQDVTLGNETFSINLSLTSVGKGMSCILKTKNMQIAKLSLNDIGASSIEASSRWSLEQIILLWTLIVIGFVKKW